MSKALIISDGKPGHFNQSIALCKHLNLDYEIAEVTFKRHWFKALSYLFDRAGLYTRALFAASSFNIPNTAFDLVISTGSGTYYANKVLACKRKLPNIAILHPKGFRLDFSHIFCPAYDHPPKRDNITELPLNLCAADPAHFDQCAADFKTRHTPEKSAIGIIIGGPNAVSTMDANTIRTQLEQIIALTPGQEHWITTSRRTPKSVEAVINALDFDYKLINSEDAYNPVPAFIGLCDHLFVTSDSASMISECACFGHAAVDVLLNTPLQSPNKFEELIHGLEQQRAVRPFDGTLGTCNQKIDLAAFFKAVTPLIKDSKQP